MMFLNLMFEIKEITPSPFQKSAKSEERERETEKERGRVQYCRNICPVY